MANASVGDAARDNLRTAVAAVEREISHLSPPGDAPRPCPELSAAWTELVKVLALGPAAATRECPVCRGTGMRAATRCAHCWAKLAPLAELGHEAPRRDA